MENDTKIGKAWGVQDQDKNLEKPINIFAYKDKDEQHSEYIHNSVKQTFKTTRIIIIVEWCLIPLSLFITIFMSEQSFLVVPTMSLAIALPMFSSTVVGIQFVRRQNIIKGLCVSYIGMLTFGIWPLIYTSKQRALLNLKLKHNI